jgi:ribonuclease HI
MPVDAQSSTEAEWFAVFFGLKSALENGYEDLHLQNDCLSIIQAFLPNANPPRKTYAKYFKTKIQTFANEANWVGISWIPRELNRADEVLV